jgi:hypothetical protein
LTLDARPGGRFVAAVGLLSAAIPGYEVSLMRVLLVASWHHFAFLVLSCALMGFGASGTLLYSLRRVVAGRTEAVLFWVVLASAAAMPLCTGAASHVPIDARLAPALLARQALNWIVFWALLTLPFLAGAAGIGAALLGAGRRSGLVYGANMIGAAAGALAAPALMGTVPPAWLPAVFGAAAWVGAAILWSGPRRAAGLGGCAVGVMLLLAFDPPAVRMDQFKRGALMGDLAAAGSVRLAGRVLGARAVVEAYRGDVLHDAPFLSPGSVPPRVSVLLADGHTAGAVLDARSAREATAMDGALAAFAYALAPPRPRVALLGEVGGQNAWLALRREAVSIDLVQPDANLLRLLGEALRDHGGGVLEQPGVRAHVTEPRHFIEHASASFDLIQLSSLETSAAGSGGVGGLAEDHLATVGGLRACLSRLSPQGVLAVARGIQDPPRDNIRIAATMIEALRHRGADEPGAHLIVVRDFLAVCTVARVTPWSPIEVEHVRRLCCERQLTPVWFPGVRPQELNAPDALPPAPDGVGDWYHHAVVRLLGHGRSFIDEYAFDVRPPTDDRPFFADFFRWRALGAMRRAYGEQWPARSELAFLFVVAAGALAAAAGAGATVVPLCFLGPDVGRGRGALWVYFGALGLAYLLLEMVFISRLYVVVGDAVRAAAVAIGAFLFFSGVGSLASARLSPRRGATPLIVACLVLVGALELWLVPRVGSMIGSEPLWLRLAGAALLLAPLAFLMGFPMPMGLCRLGEGGVAWAWAVNGFASVLAAPLAMAIAMTWGYRTAGVAALCLYVVAAMASSRLPIPAPSPRSGEGPG